MDGADPGESVLKATVADTLDVLSWEIELAAARSIYLDSVIGQMIGLLPETRKAEFLESMHVVDLLSQQLTGLSAFSRRMSGEVPDVSAHVSQALDQISLGALADRMSVALGGIEKGLNDGDGAGDLDLF
ncbi:MAG TPA: hypothetical protein VGM25_01805 [Caulobacteraceae bacterium]|jgi:hypothetical protein